MQTRNSPSPGGDSASVHDGNAGEQDEETKDDKEEEVEEEAEGQVDDTRLLSGIFSSAPPSSATKEDLDATFDSNPYLALYEEDFERHPVINLLSVKSHQCSTETNIKQFASIIKKRKKKPGHASI